MAFSSTASRTVAVVADDSWKATAFLNIYIKSADGTRRKLGAINLKDSKAFDKAVIERLTAGGDDAIAALKGVLDIDFVRADREVAVSAVGF